MPYTPVELHCADAAGRDHAAHAVTMNEHGWHVHATLACFLLLSTPAWAQPRADRDAALAAFSAATHQYAVAHRRLEQGLSPMVITASREEIHRAIERMAIAMRVARPNAQPGEFFTAAVAPIVRAQIAIALRSRGLTREDVRMAEMAGGVDAGAVTLRVNETFPWIVATAMFPCVLAALPALPPELQYRIVGDDLVMIDVHAGLVVDVLPAALGGRADTER